MIVVRYFHFTKEFFRYSIEHITNKTKVDKACALYKRGGITAVIDKITEHWYQLNHNDYVNKQYKRWVKKYYPDKKTLNAQRQHITTLEYQPLISILLPTYNTKGTFLRACINSVIDQSYENWELCIVDDNSPDQKVRDIILEYQSQDKRIKSIFRTENGHICNASNDALSLATGRFVSLMDHDDVLWPNALYEVVAALNDNKKIDFIYTDEDKIAENGRDHIDPFFKPDWSPDYLRSINYITHFATLRKSLVEKVGGFRLGTEGAQDWDLFLRATTEINKKDSIILNNKKNAYKTSQYIHHIPTILYSWRKSETSTASEKSSGKVKPYAYVNQEIVLRDDLQRRGVKGRVKNTKYLGVWSMQYAVMNKPKVSIIILNKDKANLMRACLRSIQKTRYQNYEVVVIDTGSTSTNTSEVYTQYKKKLPLKAYTWSKAFNYSAANNYGAAKATGEYLLFLNNDTEIISRDWIEKMLQHAQRKEIGAVGAALFYPDYTIQHYGGVLGIGYDDAIKIAGHAHKTKPKNGFVTVDTLSVKNYSFVTAACLMVKKTKFEKVNGFNEKLAIAYNDVDFCLRLTEKIGTRNVFTPHAQLIHKEGESIPKSENATRDQSQLYAEQQIFMAKWGNIVSRDPYYNINLTHEKEDFTLSI